ncbi:MAG: sigma-54 interaction domain-containing protein, partial [Myxococcaceae bacterium]
GVERQVLKNGRLLYGRDGKPVGGLEALRDVTELNQARLELREQADRFATERSLLGSLASRLDEPLLVVDRNGRINVMWPPAAKLLGLLPGQARGVAVRDMVRSPAELDELLLRVLSGGGGGALTGLRLRRRGQAPVNACIGELAGASGEILGAVIRLSSLPQPEGELLAPGVIGHSPSMRRLIHQVIGLAGREVSVLLTGETGSGKEVIARALHLAGPRRDRPFQAVNCAALPGALLESELFGHEKGAFTDALNTRPGRFELAGDGTLLLDEIGCLPPGMQAKLLRALDQREFERVGGTRTLKLRARVIAATNSDLAAEVRAGRFRADLYYRLRVVPLEVPPLRKRREDVLPLALHFLREARGPMPARFSASARAALQSYAWPGNVRELKNAVQYAASMSQGEVLDLGELPADIQRCARAGCAAPQPERSRLARALLESRHNHSRAAAALGISRTTLWRKLRRLGLD